MEKLQLSFERGKIVEDPKDAHGVAWAVLEPKGELKKVYLQHPVLKDDEVRIRVTYSGICQSDVTVIMQKFGLGGILPIIAGHEIIGRIHKLGKDVKGLKEGELVGVGPIRECCKNCTYCDYGQTNLCEGVPFKMTIGPWFGGFSTSVQVPSSYVIKIPDGIKEEEAPPLMCAGGTMFNPLRRFGSPGKKCAILGIGGLGHLGVQFASKMGMKTYAVSTSDNKKDLIKKLGAHEYVNSKDNDQFENFKKEKIDLMINTTSSGDAESYMKALRRGGGVFVQVGGPEEQYKISPADILLNELILAGSAAASVNDMNLMLEFAKTFGVVSKNEYYSFDDFPKAYKRTAFEKPEFRVVVNVKDYDTSNCLAN